VERPDWMPRSIVAVWNAKLRVRYETLLKESKAMKLFDYQQKW